MTKRRTIHNPIHNYKKKRGTHKPNRWVFCRCCWFLVSFRLYVSSTSLGSLHFHCTPPVSVETPRLSWYCVVCSCNGWLVGERAINWLTERQYGGTQLGTELKRSPFLWLIKSLRLRWVIILTIRMKWNRIRKKEGSNCINIFHFVGFFSLHFSNTNHSFLQLTI